MLLPIGTPFHSETQYLASFFGFWKQDTKYYMFLKQDTKYYMFKSPLQQSRYATLSHLLCNP